MNNNILFTKERAMITMKNRILSFILTLSMMFSVLPIINVGAAETEIDGGDTFEQATEISLNTEYAVSVDESFEEDYFSFTTTNEGFYEVISVANNNAHTVQILSASGKELAEGTFYNDEKVLSEKLKANETYLIKISKGSYYGKTEEGKYFFEINYKEDVVADNIDNAEELSLNEKFDTELEGADDVDWFMYTNDSSMSQIVTVSFANNTGSGKWYFFCNESEDRIDIVGYNNYELSKGYTRDVDIALEPNQQLFVKIWFEHDNRYEIGENGYYILVTERQCEHERVSNNNYVTEYEEIRGDENYHYIIKYYDKICDECRGTIERRTQESKYKEMHSFSGDTCTKCAFEKESEQEHDTPVQEDDKPISNDNTTFDPDRPLPFTDSSSINIAYELRVNLLVQLNIIGGYPDGSFRPLSTLTRAEAAKLIYILNVGYDDGGADYVNSYCPFYDVTQNANWAKGYINYCYQKGIVGGLGNGTFNPNGKVTIVELSKMLLVCLGADATKEGYGGQNWAGNVIVDGIDFGVFDDWAGDPTMSASRELACLLIANTLEAPVARYLPFNDVLSQMSAADPNEKNESLGEYLGLIPNKAFWDEWWGTIYNA